MLGLARRCRPLEILRRSQRELGMCLSGSDLSPWRVSGISDILRVATSTICNPNINQLSPQFCCCLFSPPQSVFAGPPIGRPSDNS